MKTVKSSQSLIEQQLISEEDKVAISKVIEQFSVSIPDEILSKIQQESLKQEKGPLYKQFVPSVEELEIQDIESADPIGDEAFSVVKGIIHRYPDRCLLLPMQVCPVYCRFCFRRETVAKAKSSLTRSELEMALNYIQNTPSLWEVIITGGDPLFLKPKALKQIIMRLEQIPHLEVIRIHTRIPILTPKRIDDAMLDALKTSKALYIGIHANHPNEFNAASEAACAKLSNAGIVLLGNTVLLKGINDNVETLGKLMRIFVKNRIKPYYVHQGDLAQGTSHFRTTLEAGQVLMKALRGHYSGLCQPTYILDIPGGYGKVPICAEYIEAVQQGSYRVKDYRETKHAYPPKS